jgi:hypothetical protein
MRNKLPITLLAFSLLFDEPVQPQGPALKAGPNLALVVRSPHSTRQDLQIPLCATEFGDGLAKNGIAFRGEEGVVLRS